MIIKTNIAAIHAQRELAKTSRAISRSLSRLSSGESINSGADRSMAIAFEAQIRGTHHAVRSINETQSMLQVAESALSKQIELIQSMRELALQAGNSTLNGSDRDALSTNLQSLLSQFQEITNSTEFNGIHLLSQDLNLNLLLGASKDDPLRARIESSQANSTFTKTVGKGTFQTRMGTKIGSDTMTDTVSADINNDGIMDIISTSRLPELIINFGTGTGVVGASITYSSLGGFIKIGDINGDGVSDIVQYDNGNNIGIHLGNGDGSFRPLMTQADTVTQRKIQLADLNRDGKQDLIGLTSSGQISVHYGTASGLFSAPTTYSRATLTSSDDLAVGDFNNDGIVDIATTDFINSAVRIRLGKADGKLGNEILSSAGSTPTVLASGDINGDGKIDLVVGSNASVTRPLLGNGDGTFTNGTNLSNTGNVAELRLADLNNDGNLDLYTYMSGTNGNIRFGNGNGTFQSLTTLALGVATRRVSFVDLNNDNALDLIGIQGVSFNTQIANTTTIDALSEINVSTVLKAQNLLTVLDNALKNVEKRRQDLSHLYSRLDYAASTNLLMSENYADAKSKAVETDIALEITELTRNQILQQTQLAVLTQANVNMQVALQLFKEF